MEPKHHSETVSDTDLPWGQYAPPSGSWPLTTLINLRLAHGYLKKKIIRNWNERFGPIVDIEYSGIKYRLNLTDNVTDLRILTSHKSYDSVEINALKKSSSRGTFVDLGANIGFYSLSLAAAGAKVIAVEPNPKTLERLRYNARLNEFGKNITIIPVGIGEEGEFELVSSGDLGSATIRPGGHSSAKESITIQTKPLVEILADRGIQKVDGLKIDIEGMEDRALIPFFAEAPKSLWPSCVVIEHCTKDHWERDVISHMFELGYTCSHKTRANSILHLAAA
jgi:FkbM family methyltransferase